MAIADRLNKLRTDIEDTYQAINEIGGTIPSDKNTNNIPEAIRSVYDNLPKVSDTGTNVSLSPTLKGRLGIVPKGNTLQDGEPTPDTPVEIQSATGTQKVVVSGKNLFDVTKSVQGGLNSVGGYISGGVSSYTITGNSVEITTTQTYRGLVSDYIKIEPNTNYSISYNKPTTGVTYFSLFRYYDDSKTYIGNITSTNARYVRFNIGINETGTFKIQNIQLEQGSTVTPYQSYQEPQEVDIELSNIELNKIGDYEDHIDGTPDNWVLYKQVAEISSYNGETITTTYMSTTGGLDTGARVLYGITETTEAITDTNLISQLNELYYLQSYNDTTNIDVTGNLPMRITASAIKGA